MYGLHPDQLLAPAPVTELASRHPNHVWQIDASLCTLYCLGNGAKGLQGMEGQVYYKNKPGNLERIGQPVWRYVVTDHASGWLYVSTCSAPRAARTCARCSSTPCRNAAATT
jgi:hypothetical protein